uniref:Ribosomal protein L29 n=1 Tax=Neotessella volvocina TaxID=52559 RepID=A0A3G2R045_9STRA|nr:ribosomal protein L29 [Neotessella volvocina]
MSLPKYSELKALSNIVDIEKEIFLYSKNLFDLKLKRATNQVTQPHNFKHLKRRLAQLKFHKSCLLRIPN